MSYSLALIDHTNTHKSPHLIHNKYSYQRQWRSLSQCVLFYHRIVARIVLHCLSQGIAMLSPTATSSTITSPPDPYKVSSSNLSIASGAAGLSNTSSLAICHDGTWVSWRHSPMPMTPIQVSQKHDKCRCQISVESRAKTLLT